MDEALIRKQLEACLATKAELDSGDWQNGWEDEWPIPKAYPIE